MRRETSRNRAAKQIRTQNILCGLGFSLYIRASPHQAHDSVLRDLGGFFCRPEHEVFGGALFGKNAHD
jgi:hypothetical protein